MAGLDLASVGAILLTAFGIGALILVHELGHFVAAKLVGMRVLSFSIGFGPAVASFRRGETTYKLAAIPLGGYVLPDGGYEEQGRAGQGAGSAAQVSDPAHPGDTPSEAHSAGDQAASVTTSEPDEPTASAPGDPRRYENRPGWAKLAFILAGPLLNWLFAVVLAVGLLALGLPRPVLEQARVGGLQDGGPAALGGLRVEDRIIAVEERATASWQDLLGALGDRGAVETRLLVMRDGQSLAVTLTPRGSAGGQGVLGIYPAEERGPSLPLHQALVAAPLYTLERSAAFLGQLWAMATGSGSGELMGIPGIARTVFAQAVRGLPSYLGVLFVLSLSLAFLNLVPVPGLDGGRLLMLGLGRLLGRRLTPRVETYATLAGWVAVGGLILAVSVRDVVRIVSQWLAG